MWNALMSCGRAKELERMKCFYQEPWKTKVISSIWEKKTAMKNSQNLNACLNSLWFAWGRLGSKDCYLGITCDGVMLDTYTDWEASGWWAFLLWRFLGVLADTELNTSHQCALAAKRSNCILECIKHGITSQSKKMILLLYLVLVHLHLNIVWSSGSGSPGSWTWWLLKVPSNWIVLYYILFI